MGYALSFATQYGLATAVLFLIKDTFSSAKLLADLNPAGATDSTSGPYNTVSNMVLFVRSPAAASSLESQLRFISGTRDFRFKTSRLDFYCVLLRNKIGSAF